MILLRRASAVLTIAGFIEHYRECPARRKRFATDDNPTHTIAKRNGSYFYESEKNAPQNVR